MSLSNDATPVVQQPITASGAKLKGNLSRKLKDKMREMWKFRLSYLFIAPFLIVFSLFIIIPVLTGVALSFTYFNSIEFPKWAGWMNYQNLFSQDVIFLKHVIPNSFKFALFVGPIGYVLSFVLAWLIAQLPSTIRVWYALAMYAPSLTGGIAMVVVWQVMFTGDRTGYINSFLLKWGFIDQPVLLTIDKEYLLGIMIIVSIWSSMGLGFLAILAGILNVDRTLYEAGRIDGISSRLQEIWYITIPMMKPQMLFAAVMAIVGTLKSGGIGTQLSGMNPTPDYSGQLFMNHIEDFGFTRLELGYASAISIVLLILTILLSRFLWMLLGPKEDE
ncbi:MAG: sugar ABC transporter permease [Paenibacillus sp.]|uniref:Carbohydrate ABC transporter membrane protein 1, CUT1 family n=1 Tax=Paenibacillus aquistagni TaxID=1852522 RepID=A0A1X7I4I3_9BACL|nr:sugar ABC transporter permease [Paenibacillus sp.]SMG09340.1 carbohydrate ABC transporter membrane protein 1, CUT1 family [Paenibacillus aquistagni]